MLVLVVVMMVCVALALAVVLVVAVPARREGREVLTPRGEQVVARVRAQSESVASATRGQAARLAGHLPARLRRRTTHGDAAAADGARPSPELPPSGGTANATS